MSGNPWLDDVEPSRNPSRWADDDDEEEFDPNKDYFTQVVKKKEVDMVKSTERSLAMIYESEQIGAKTGEELLRQGEALRRTEKRVDQMEHDLKESDRHIASIKSLWGAFMNKFKKEPAPPPVTNYDESESKLERAVESSRVGNFSGDDNYDEHPVLARQQENRQIYSGGSSSTRSQQEKNERMEQVDRNLDHMMDGLSRLKDLGIGLGQEIETQDKVLTRLGDKVSRVDEKTHQTNKKLIKLNNS